MRRALNRGINEIAKIVARHFRNQAALLRRNLSKFIRKQENVAVQREVVTLSLIGFEDELARFSEEILATELTEMEVFGNINFTRATGRNLIGEELVEFDRRSLAFLDRTVPEFTVSIETTTRANIRNIIRNGFDEGKTASKVVDDLKERFLETARQGRASAGRIFTIARTETGRAQSFSVLHSGIIAGERFKQWIWSGIQRDFHAQISGQTVKINENFTTGLGNRGPGPRLMGKAIEDINCACLLITLPEKP